MALLYHPNLSGFIAMQSLIGAGNGYIVIYTGPKPADCTAASTGTIIAEGDMPAMQEFPSPGTDYGTTKTVLKTTPTPPDPMYALATGTPGYWRIFNSSAKSLPAVMQGEIGVGKSMQLATITDIGQGIRFNSFEVYGPNIAGAAVPTDIQTASTTLNGTLTELETFPDTIAYNDWPKTFDLYTGTPPASPDLAATGTKLLSITLPSDWMSNPSGAAVTLNATVSGAAIAGGTATYFRIHATSTDAEVEVSGVELDLAQGTVGVTGSGADIEMPSNVIALGQTVSLTQFTVSGANNL